MLDRSYIQYIIIANITLHFYQHTKNLWQSKIFETCFFSSLKEGTIIHLSFPTKYPPFLFLHPLFLFLYLTLDRRDSKRGKERERDRSKFIVFYNENIPCACIVTVIGNHSFTRNSNSPILSYTIKSFSMSHILNMLFKNLLHEWKQINESYTIKQKELNFPITMASK